MPRRLLSIGAWTAIASAVAELCAREVARRSLFGSVAGFTPGTLSLLIAVGMALWAAARLRRGLLLFAALFAIGLSAQVRLGARLQSDGFYYYAYLRSIAFDHDVNFVNDYTLLGLTDKPQLFIPTRTAHAQSAASIGPAILWAPFFAAGHVLARGLGAKHPEIDANGISFPYRQAVCVAGLFYGLIGCWFCFRMTRRYFSAPLAALAVTLAVTGSFLLWYFVKEPSMTHAPSMAAVAAFIWAWLATREAAGDREVPFGSRTMKQWAWLGVLAGFMSLIRWQNALFALLPACDAVIALVTAARTSNRRDAAQVLAGGIVFMAAAVLAFTPQMIAWHSIYGSWLAVSPLGPQIRWAHPQLADILWSSRNGLLSWSPILYVGAVGLVMFAVAEPAVGIPAVIAVAAMIYFNATIQDWWGSDGFGGRRFDGTIPLFCVGIAAFGSYCAGVTRRHPLRVVAAAGAVLALWNITLMSAANDNVFRLGTTVSFGDTFAAQARAFHRWFGNPFTYPASLLFGALNDVPPSRYDLLRANRFLGDPLRPYGRIDIGSDDGWLLEEGWHAAEREGASTFRWAYSPAIVLIPLDHAAPLTLRIRLHAFTYPGWGSQRLSVTINNRDFPPVPIGGDWNVVEVATDAGVWHGGVNRVKMQFQTVQTPAAVGLSGDTRELAAAVDYILLSAQ